MTDDNAFTSIDLNTLSIKSGIYSMFYFVFRAEMSAVIAYN